MLDVVNSGREWRRVARGERRWVRGEWRTVDSGLSGDEPLTIAGPLTPRQYFRLFQSHQILRTFTSSQGHSTSRSFSACNPRSLFTTPHTLAMH